MEFVFGTGHEAFAAQDDGGNEWEGFLKMAETRLNALQERYQDLIESLPTDLVTPDNYTMCLLLLAKMKNSQILGEVFEGSKNKVQAQEYIDAAIRAVHGDGFGLTQHGVARTLSAKFSDSSLTRVGQALREFEEQMKTHLNVRVFITSGTLLGMVRSGRIIPHDDDFDLAYVSQFSETEDILRERREISRFLSTHDTYLGRTREKHFTIEYNAGGLRFFFDLFPAWVRNGMFTEVPLRPAALSADNILPLSRIDFYGVDIPAPRNPEALLEVNYGPSWRHPDPSFRFDFGEFAGDYWFLHEDFMKEDFGHR